MKCHSILYVTDIEGNLNYLNNFIANSQGISWSITTTGKWNCKELILHDGYMLVFGGDSGDKGNGTLRCLEIILNLKKKYKERVILLLGNRDINKMRFTSELDVSDLPYTSQGPYWVPEDNRVSPMQYLLQDVVTDSTDVEIHNTQTNRLKWMLQYTMGSEGDFQRRRQELAIIQGLKEENITDELVFSSFLESVQEGGLIREYLEHAVLGFIAMDILFVHGGISGYFNGTKLDCFYQIPQGLTQIKQLNHESVVQMNTWNETNSIREWITNLNQWCRDQIEEWKFNPKWNSTRSFRGGELLLDYSVPTSFPSVIMGRHLEPSGMPCVLSSHVINSLHHENIHRVVVGHTPHGHSPTIIKCTNQESNAIVDIIMGDTSYSDPSALDHRGKAVATILLKEHITSVQGVLPDSTTYSFTTSTNRDVDSDRFIGKQLRNGEWVKVKVQNNDYITFIVSGGRNFCYHYRTRQEVESWMI